MLKQQWFAELTWASLRGDLFGGLTAAVVALPLALAVGALTGVGAAAGLYGAIFTGIFAALFGGTATQITGPTLTTMAVVYTTFAVGGWEHLVLATIFAGLFQIGFGLARLGRYITFIPQPVVAGFTNGMAIYIFAKQIPIFGAAPIIGLAVIVIMLVWPRINHTFPGSLVALLVTTGAAAWLGWSDAAYLLWPAAPVIEHIPVGFPAFHVPMLSLSAVQPAFVAGLTLALIASMETLLSSLIVDEMTHSRHKFDRELIGQGIGNVVTAFFRGLIGNGAIVRSVVNTRAGGRTRLSGVFHGIVILIITMSFGWMAEMVPLATLAGILMVTAVGMIDWQSVRDLRQMHPGDAAVMLTTAVLTYATQLTFAIGIGVLMSSVLFAMRMAQSRVTSEQAAPDLTVISVDGPLFFGDANLLMEKAENTTGTVILDLSRMTVIDATGAVTLRKLGRYASETDHPLVVCGVSDSCRATLDNLAALEGIKVYPTLAAGLLAEGPLNLSGERFGA